ncbi:hypothetical protein FRC12_015888 [Ceratobasidium sp. 428]|nr:hypothetical protein FRC12_015888 [Ceratobasidium sp. 428]
MSRISSTGLPISISWPIPIFRQTSENRHSGWGGLAKFSNVLKESAISALAPLQAAIENISECVEIFESAAEGQEEYRMLRVELDPLFHDLAGHFGGSASHSITSSIINLAKGIEQEMSFVRQKSNRKRYRRYIEAKKDVDEVLECYRRVKTMLERLVINANINIWKSVDDQTTACRARLRELSPSHAAWYSSAESTSVRRDGCTPNTRVVVLEKLTNWAREAHSEKVYWLNGMAGTGKTTIAYSFCERLDKDKRLAACFFCSRQLPSCRDANLILPTLAYQLAGFSMPFRHVLSGILQRNPDVYARNLPSQFESLILRPLQEVENSVPTDLVIVIDALDECDNNDGVSRMLDILLSRDVELPIRFFVTSRPEPEIYDRMLSRKGPRTRFELHLHELERSIVQEDIKTYLRANLMPADLPRSDIDRLAEHSGTLFIHAATAVRYILGDNGSRSIKRLQKILDTSNSSSKAYKQIDALYTVILRGAFDDANLDERDKQEMRLVLHTVICAREPLTASLLASLLVLDGVDSVHVALRYMFSVLHFQGVYGRITALHQSFPDYILDSNRSLDYHCDAKEHNSMMAQRCFDLMKVPNPPFNICNLESSFLLDREVPNLDKEIEEAISNELFYACRYWGAHLLAVERAKSLVDELHYWARERFLLWLEVMNLKRCLSDGAGMLSRIESWLKLDGHAEDTWTLIQDAYTFTIAFMSSPMSDSTPHIYLSALGFWPRQKPIAKFYRPKMRGLVEVAGGPESEQKPEALVICKNPSHITCIAVSPNGTAVASGCTDNTICIRDIHTGQVTGKTLIGHTNTVSSVVYSPDGARIASSSLDKTICIWDVQTLAMIGGPFEASRWGISSIPIAYSPDGRYILSGSSGHSIRIWDVDTRRMVTKSLGNRYDEVNSVTYAPNGALLASASSNGTVCVWDAQTLAMIGQPLVGHTSSVNSVVFSPDSARIISGSSDCTIRIWDARTGRQMEKPLRGHTSGVYSIAYAPNGKYVISGSSDHTMRIWNLQTRESQATDISATCILPSDGRFCFYPRSVAFALQGTRIICLESTVLSVWDTHTSSANLTSSWFADLTSEYGFSTLVAMKRLRRWINRSSPEYDGEGITSVAYSRDGTFIFSGSKDHSIRIWDPHSGSMTGKPLKGHSGIVKAVACAPNGLQIASGSVDTTLRIWDLHTGKAILRPLKGHTRPVLSLAYSPEGARIASGSDDNTILIWDAYTGQAICEPLKGHENSVNSVTYTADGRFIVSGSEDSSIRIWDAHNGQPVGKPLLDSGGSVFSVACAPDCMRIVSGSSKGIRTWNIRSGQLIKRGFGHRCQVLRVLWTPDSARIVSSSNEGTIFIWDASTLCIIDELVTPSRHFTGRPEIHSISLSPTGEQIASGCSESTIHVWEPFRMQKADASSGTNIFGDRLNYSCEGEGVMESSDHHNLDPGVSASDGWAVVDVNHKLHHHPFNYWYFDQDGWVVVSDTSNRLIWIPEEVRATVQPSQIVTMIPPGRWLKLDFSQVLVGNQWSLCYQT